MSTGRHQTGSGALQRSKRGEERERERGMSTFTGTDSSSPHDRERSSIPKGKWLLTVDLLVQ